MTLACSPVRCCRTLAGRGQWRCRSCYQREHEGQSIQGRDQEGKEGALCSLLRLLLFPLPQCLPFFGVVPLNLRKRDLTRLADITI